MTLQNARWKLEIWYEIKSFESKGRDELLHQLFPVTPDLGSSRFGSFQFCYVPNLEEIRTYIKEAGSTVPACSSVFSFLLLDECFFF